MKKHLLLFTLLLLISGMMYGQIGTPYTIAVQADSLQGEAYIIVGEQHFTEYNFNEGETCYLYANPDEGYFFVKWTEDGEVFSSQADTSFVVTHSMTLVANFEELPPTQYTISVQAEPEEGGVAYIIVGEQNVTEWTFNEGDTCWLNVNPAEGYFFVSWKENGEVFSTQADTSFVVTDSMNLVANFVELPPTIYTITVLAEPEEGGNVDGEGEYPEGTVIELSAHPNTGYSFDHWDDGETLNPRTVEVTCDATYTAIFTPKPYTITVQAEPFDGGEVIGGGTHNFGSTVTLTANAYVGYTFSQWQDGDTNSTRTITVAGDAVYTAFFTLNQYAVEVMSNPEEGGTVVGNGIYTHGVTCTLTAIPNDGYSFSNWMDDDNVVVSSELTYSFVVTENASFTANFTRQYNINVEATPDGTGSVTGAGTYDYGAECTLTATPSEAYFFVNWTEDGLEVSTDTTYSFIVTSDRNLVANFKEIPCIDNIQEIVAKEHKERNETYILVLVYPNPNDETYQYQWLYSEEEDGEYTELNKGTYAKQYYYKGGPLDDGYYAVRLSQDGCSAITAPIHVENGLNNLRIYPNPSRRGSSIVIENDYDGPAQLTIYAMDGRLLHTQTVTSDQATINIGLPSGVYVAYLTDSEGYTHVGKLIIK